MWCVGVPILLYLFNRSLRHFYLRKLFIDTLLFLCIYLFIYLFIEYNNLVYTLWCAFEYYVHKICALKNKGIIIIITIIIRKLIPTCHVKLHCSTYYINISKVSWMLHKYMLLLYTRLFQSVTPRWLEWVCFFVTSLWC